MPADGWMHMVLATRADIANVACRGTYLMLSVPASEQAINIDIHGCLDEPIWPSLLQSFQRIRGLQESSRMDLPHRAAPIHRARQTSHAALAYCAGP